MPSLSASGPSNAWPEAEAAFAFFFSQESGEGGHRAAAPARDHQQPPDDGHAVRQEPFLLRRLELRHDVPGLLSGLLRVPVLLLSQRRGTSERPVLSRVVK